MSLTPRHAIAETLRRRAIGSDVAVARSDSEVVYAPIKRTEADEQLVYAEVYAPFVLDTYGEYMTPEDIRKMAHRFMELDLSSVIDTNHDNVPNGAYPVESYIARADDPDFTEGAWVLGVKIPDVALWEKVLNGDLNGFSFEAMCTPRMDTVEVSILRDHVGRTRTEKGVDHEHMFFVQVNDKGRVVRGHTSPGPDGHVHEIRAGTRTMRSGTDGHLHRYDMF